MAQQCPEAIGETDGEHTLHHIAHDGRQRQNKQPEGNAKGCNGNTQTNDHEGIWYYCLQRLH